MKKYALLSMLAVAGLMSCGKDDAKPEIDTTNGTALAAESKVYYSTKIKGQLPDGTGGALSLSVDEEDVMAIDGRYVMISPAPGGDVTEGYYVQFKGDTSGYYKVDYSLARNARQAAGQEKGHGLFKTQDGASPEDSLITIKLPDGVKTGNFVITIAAYSAGGGVSNSVDVTVKLVQPAGLSSLVGTWKFTGEMNHDSTWDRDVYAADSSVGPVYCLPNGPTNFCPSGNCEVASAKELVYRYQMLKNEVVLSSNGNFTSTEVTSYTYIDWAASACGNLVRKTDENTFAIKGGWSYDVATKTLYTVMDENGAAGTEYVYFDKMKVELTGKTAIFFEEEYASEYTKK
ncbi:hypothetical protein MKQ68_01000 [Chitinophaga horti]|uniref:DUF1735 domain-containing protein n=1 Tax=Chitinophaga horti TaxID=2920382 RepID=A0ABY6J1X8_9BACT|nr:hypothetical protein [Chitinophaga horti]UYQ93678.1 hypothetical protein MKQ68_01000 [Chitinophaga horti]